MNDSCTAAIVYEVLYKKVFRMGNEATKAVEKMLHDKNYTRQRRAHLPCPMRLPDHIDVHVSAKYIF